LKGGSIIPALKSWQKHCLYDVALDKAYRIQRVLNKYCKTTTTPLDFMMWAISTTIQDVTKATEAFNSMTHPDDIDAAILRLALVEEQFQNILKRRKKYESKV
jgi:hypothetical protein